MCKTILISFILLFNNLTYTQWIPAPDTIKNIRTILVNGSNIYAGGAGNIYFSPDNGNTWDTKSNGLKFSSSIVDIAAKDSVFIIGCSGDGVYISTDYGKTWTERDNGLKTKNVKYVAINGNYLFAGEDYNPITFEQGGLYKSTDLGESWVRVNSLPTGNISALFSNSSRLIVGIGSLYASQDNGNTWKKIFNNSANSVTIIDNDIFVASGDSVSVSKDNGNTWEKRSNGLTLGYTNKLTKIDSLIFVTEGNSKNKFFISKNKGISWIQIDSSNLSPNKGITAIGANNSFLFISLFTGGIWKRTIEQIITSIESNKMNPKTIKLFPNFPNPFNPNTTISYQIPEFSKVQLIVYDLLGREITTLVNEEQSAGNYKVIFNATNLASGVYIYRINVNDFSTAKKLLLMK